MAVTEVKAIVRLNSAVLLAKGTAVSDVTVSYPVGVVPISEPGPTDADTAPAKIEIIISSALLVVIPPVVKNPPALLAVLFELIAVAPVSKPVMSFSSTAAMYVPVLPPPDTLIVVVPPTADETKYKYNVN